MTSTWRRIMKTMLTTLAFLAALPATAALADDDDCKAPATQAQSWEAVTQLANDYGWTIHWMEMDDGCYELRVTDVGGETASRQRSTPQRWMSSRPGSAMTPGRQRPELPAAPRRRPPPRTDATQAFRVPAGSRDPRAGPAAIRQPPNRGPARRRGLFFHPSPCAMAGPSRRQAATGKDWPCTTSA